jgi:phosphoglycolate phosphatase-like HAD superfamily hydrolase
VKAILFDWDGTLADSHAALYAANAAVMEAFGLPFDRGLYRLHYSPDWNLMYHRLGVPADRLDEANRIWLTAFGAAEGVALFPGVREALYGLARAGTVLGIVTAGPGTVVRPQIERLELDALLTIRVYGDDLVEQKPDPAPLRRALVIGSLADQPAAAAYLGDTPEDMRMAVRAGVRAIGVVSGMGESDGLIEAGAAEIAESVPVWARRELSDSTAAPAIGLGVLHSRRRA